MLKFYEQIQNLTVDQKISLITDASFISQKGAELGLPRLDFVTLDDLYKEGLFPFSAMANTWSKDAIGVYATEASAICARLNKTVILIEAPHLTANLYADGLSEDPVLAGELVKALVVSLYDNGITPVLYGCGMRKIDIEVCDEKYNERIVQEYFLRPLRKVLACKELGGVIDEYTLLKGSYRDVNEIKVRPMVHSAVKNNGYIFTKGLRGQDAVREANHLCPLCFDGDAPSLYDGVVTARIFESEIQKGLRSPEELEQACEDGVALPESKLDETVNALLEFAKKAEDNFLKHHTFNEQALAQEPVEEQTPVEEIAETTEVEKDMTSDDDIAIYADEEEEKIVYDPTALSPNLIKITPQTLVLLKNKDGLLPLGTRKKIAVIGQLSRGKGGGPDILDEIKSRHKRKFNAFKFADGYELDGNRNERLASEACTLARQVDTTVLVLGFTEKYAKRFATTRCTRLPANQVMLYNRIRAEAKSLVVILCCNGKVDTAFEKEGECDALVYAPYLGQYGGRALTDVIIGDASPSGKLPTTIYDDADEYYLNFKSRAKNQRNKIGTLVGYRRYITEGEQVRYPFGHGLSYARFTYSGFSVNKENISVTVHNASHTRCCEVVQIFTTKKESSVVRPERELYAFVAVDLPSGGRKRITIKKKDLMLVYDAKEQKWIQEPGIYDVSVASSGEKRLTQPMVAYGTKIEKKEEPSEYLTNKSNIVIGGYVMEKPVKMQKANGALKFFTAIFILLAILVDVAYAVGYMMNALSFIDLTQIITDFYLKNLASLMDAKMFNIVNIALIIGLNFFALLFIIFSVRSKKRRVRRYHAEIKRLKEKEEKEEVANPTRPFEALFVSEFAEEDDYDEEEEEEDGSFLDRKTGYAEYYDYDMTLSSACEDFVKFAEERGIVIDYATVRTLFASMSSSRIVIIKESSVENQGKLLRIISEYFAGKTYYDEFNENYSKPDHLMYAPNQYGIERETECSLAFSDAHNDASVIRIATLNEVEGEKIGSIFMPFMRFLVNPDKPYSVQLDCGGNQKTFMMSPNIWFFMGLKEDAHEDTLPIYLASAASIVNLTVSTCPESEEKTEVKKMNYYQLMRLYDDVKFNYEMSESAWKKVDRLYNYVKARDKNFTIGNKEWQRMERFVAVMLSCKCEEIHALDAMLAINLLPEMVTVVEKAKREDDDRFVHVLEVYFGEENITACRRLVEKTDLSFGG